MILNPISVLLFSGALAADILKARDASPSASYQLASTIPWSPKNATSVDQGTIYNGTYYLSDRTNNVVHVVDLAAKKQTTAIPGFQGLVVQNSTVNHAVSGPNGLLVLPDRNELYVGDGDGTVKVVNLLNLTVVANISTGATTRADEMAYNPETNTVVVTNPDEDTPVVTVISATERQVTGHITFNNASGLEQPAWNPVDKRFYISVPSTDANPGGEIAVLGASATNISTVIPLSSCIPAGIVFGPNQALFVGCSQDQILTFGVAYSQILDIATRQIVANISGLAGIDQVAYDSNAMLYYASAYQNLANASKTGAPTPQLGVIDAKTNTLLQILTTDNVTAHSVAVDTDTNQIVVPLSKNGMEIYNRIISNSTSGSGSGSGNSSSTTSAGIPKQTSGAAQLYVSSFYLGIFVVVSFLFL